VNDVQPGQSPWTSRHRPVSEDLDLQRATWRVERIAWLALLVLTAAAVAGVFGGGGPLSATRVGGAEAGLSVAYDRFARAGAGTRIRIAAAPSASQERTLVLSGAAIRSLTVDAVHPRPLEQRSTSGGAAWTFRADAGAPLVIQVEARPVRAGVLRSSFAVDGRPPVHVLQIVYP